MKPTEHEKERPTGEKEKEPPKKAHPPVDVRPDEGRPHTRFAEEAEDATTGRPIPGLERE